MAMELAKRRSSSVSGISNIAYDLMTVLHNKLEAIAALEEYKLDATDAGDQDVLNVLVHVERREREDIDQLRGLLIERMQRVQRH
jgi:hypothetical protein